MKKNVKNLLSVLGLVVLFVVATPLEVVSQSAPCEDEVITITGTKMSENPNDPWNYECMNTFTDCTDVFVLGCTPE